MIRLPSSALTQAVSDIKVCKTLVPTSRQLYFSLSAFAQPSPGINLRGRCRRWALGASSGCRDKLCTCLHIQMCTHAETHTHICIQTHAHTYTCVYISIRVHTYLHMCTQTTCKHAHVGTHTCAWAHKHAFIYKWSLARVCTT